MELRKRRDYACAVGLLDQALALIPRDVDAVLERAESHFQSSDYQRAVSDWERAAEMDASLRTKLDTRLREGRQKTGS